MHGRWQRQPVRTRPCVLLSSGSWCWGSGWGSGGFGSSARASRAWRDRPLYDTTSSARARTVRIVHPATLHWCRTLLRHAQQLHAGTCLPSPCTLLTIPHRDDAWAPQVPCLPSPFAIPTPVNLYTPRYHTLKSVHSRSTLCSGWAPLRALRVAMVGLPALQYSASKLRCSRHVWPYRIQ